MKRILLTAMAVLLSVSLSAKVELTPLFSDNMVFQQNCQAPVWGKAAACLIASRTVSAVAGRSAPEIRF